ncbi:MAG: DUF4450 domain-containing protein [Ginsengibacter sp.]
MLKREGKLAILKKFLCFVSIAFCFTVNAQTLVTPILWHNKQRAIHYMPDGKDFVCVNPTRRFNRALYGTHTAFRVEAGDLPEFAMYMPGMGGNFKFGIIKGKESKWLTGAKSIKAVYRPGSMLYEIKDPLLGDGVIHISILALADAEGMIIKTTSVNVDNQTQIIWTFGGESGKKFTRDGDIGADPESSFYLQPGYCIDNNYQLSKNKFLLSYGTDKALTDEERYEINHLQQTRKDSVADKKHPLKFLSGIFPSSSVIHIADANQQQDPLELYRSGSSIEPVIVGKIAASDSINYYLIENTNSLKIDYNDLPHVFNKAESAREKLANRIQLSTPDPYINTLAGALTIAADGIWESPSYLHGAIAWRIRLPAWRGPYVADPLGWHDRAREHFSSYALSQLTSPLTGSVVADTALHLARQLEKLGTSLYSSGYICRNPNGDFRPHHYDMNLVFIDALLNHFKWTGDLSFVKKMWPVLQRHLVWEKRNFDADGDGLYDSYADIWASDALDYSGGGVMHSSAYNYRANKMAAEIASMIGEDAAPYQKEADHIFNAMNKVLWMPSKGWYAEFKDALGLKMLHPSAALWTIYHAIDSKVPDPFQAYECLKYIDNDIPHIPVLANGLPDQNMYVLSTTNWQPYTWSLNNVVLAENLQTSLAYWQGERPEAAFTLWRSSLIQSMFLGASPGNFEQISFYDAARGELYRDFADPIGVAARTLVEGLFGIQPDALHNTLVIQPGFPADWGHASLSTPDVTVSFKKNNRGYSYVIVPSFSKKMHLQFIVRARNDAVQSITVNDKKVKWIQQENAIGCPYVQVNIPYKAKYAIVIKWKGNSFEKPALKDSFKVNEELQLSFAKAKVFKVFDPQNCLHVIKTSGNEVSALVNAEGNKTFFVEVQQGDFIYWQPFSFSTKRNEPGQNENASINANSVFDTIDLTHYYNAKVTDIFKQSYLSPRVKSPTLQLPTQGIGNWCYPLVQANINDEGLRKLAGNRNEIKTPLGVPFSTPSDSSLNNILFTSQWDNYPKEIQVSLNGSASHVYLLMAGSTNPMQSRITNGEVIVQFTDGNADTLQLRNPENWWPIEEDYIIDGYAFTTGAPFPLRLYLKAGKFDRGLSNYSTIKGLTNMAIDGGAATVLDMPLNTSKTLKSLTVKTLANDVVIGLMSVTLQRN